MKIEVERFMPHTFHGWTDGPKMVLDAMDVGPLHNQDRVTRVQVVGPKQAIHLLTEYPHEVGTFYYIGRLRDYLEIVDKFPQRDLRLLVVG